VLAQQGTGAQIADADEAFIPLDRDRGADAAGGTR